MSLETYIDGRIQAFMKQGAGNLLFGLQNAPTYKLLPIFDANESGSTASITSIEAVKIGANSSITMGMQEIDRTVLSNSLIVFDSGSNQYIVDTDVVLSTLLDECIYYLEFKNGYNVFTTEPFLVQKMDLPINWSMTVITWDSTLITFDQTNLTI
jgi:hypothetical protein